MSKKKNVASFGKSNTLALSISFTVLRKFFADPDVVWCQFKIGFENYRTAGIPEKTVFVEGLVDYRDVVHYIKVTINFRIDIDGIWHAKDVGIHCGLPDGMTELEKKEALLLSQDIPCYDSYQCDGSEGHLPIFKTI